MLDGQQVFSSSCTCAHVKDGDVVMADPFSSKRNGKYNLEQKRNLGKLCLKYNLEAEAEPKKHWDPKRKNMLHLLFHSNLKRLESFSFF